MNCAPLVVFSTTLSSGTSQREALEYSTGVWLRLGLKVVWISVDALGGSGDPPPKVLWLRLGEPMLALQGWRGIVAQAAKLTPALLALGAFEIHPWGTNAQKAAILVAKVLGLHLAEQNKNSADPMPVEQLGRKPAKWRSNLLQLLAFICGPSRALRLRAERTDKREHLATVMDIEHYLQQIDAVPEGCSLAEHYLAVGQYAGLNPHPVFWTQWYADQYLSRIGGSSVWSHFTNCGLQRGCAPNPFLIPRWYEQQPGAGQYHANAVFDYLGCLKHKSVSPDPNPLFDQLWYAKTYDIGQTPPLIHFIANDDQLPSCPFLSRHQELQPSQEAGCGGYRRLFSSGFSTTPSAHPLFVSQRLETISSLRIAVCCVLTGQYDHLPTLKYRDTGTDYFLLTDHPPAEQVTGWTVVVVASADVDPVCHSRALKMKLARFIPDADRYNTIVYVDSNVGLVGSLSTLLSAFIASGATLGLVPHPFRRCVYEEAAAILVQLRDSRENVLRTVDFLESARHPPGAGLFEMNFFCFHPCMQSEKFFDRWWSLYQRYGRRDQLLAPFVARESNLPLHALLPPGESVRTHPAFSYTAHRT